MSEDVSPLSEFLFATPSFITGAARTLDLGATFDCYNDSPTGDIADARAMYADWRAVGNAIASNLWIYLNSEANRTD